MNKEPNEKKNDFFLNYMKEKQEKEIKIAGRAKYREEGKKTITGPFVRIIDFFSQLINGFFNFSMSSNLGRILLSFVLALVFYVVIRDENSTTAKKISEVPVTVINLSDDYIVEGVPESVKVYASGSSILVNSLSYKSGNVYVDLGNCLGEGTYENIELKTSGLFSNFDTDIYPESVTVTLSKKEERVFSIDYSIINEDQIEGDIVIQKPDLGITEIKVSGKSSELDKVGSVIAQIDVKDVSGDCVLPGYFKAYDIYGNELNTVSFEQNYINVDIHTASAQKLISIKPLFINLPDDLAVSQISYNIKELYYYGYKANLANYSDLKLEINIDELDENGCIYNLPLTIPADVQCSDETIDVAITLESKGTKTFANIPIELSGEDVDLSKLTLDISNCTVQVSGANSRLNYLSLEELHCSVIVDQSMMDTLTSEGTITCDVSVSCDDALLNVSVVDHPTIQISLKK